MDKKINSSVLEHIRRLCYDVLLYEAVSSRSRHTAYYITTQFLRNEGYKINWVKCDQENNPPSVVDMGRIRLDISEEEFTGSQNEIIHFIIL